MCDRCPELEARIEGLLDELHDLKVAACRQAAIDDARTRHPSTRDDYPLVGWLTANGIARLTLVKTP
jgi:hypothetical protein